MTFTEESIVQVIRDSLGSCVAKGAHGLIDDGASLPRVPANCTRVVSCDAFQEGNDFLTDIAPVESAGYRAIVQNLSDLAAMGAKPVGFVWSLEVPKGWLGKNSLLERFCEGAASACKQYKLSFYGGDLSFAKDRFGCTITIFGDVAGAPHTRRLARPGDKIYASHKLGLSSFGLDELLARKKKRSNDAVEAHLHPTAEIKLGRKLIGIATSCMDISDGLLKDLDRLFKASKVGAELDALEDVIHPSLPPAKAREYALNGGEEFALLFTAPASQKVPKGCIRIGKIVRGQGCYEIVGSEKKLLTAQGYDHFVSRT